MMGNTPTLLLSRPIVPQPEEVERVELWSRAMIEANIQKGVPIIPDSIAGYELVKHLLAI